MKKTVTVIMFVLFITVLTACEGKMEYKATNITLDGNEVFTYETDNDVCIALYSTIIELTEDVRYEILYNCNIHKVVLYEGEYLSLTEYVENHLVSIEDLLNSNLGFPVYYDSVEHLLEIDINDFTLDEVVIRTLNGEYKEYGGEWTESTIVQITQAELSNQIVALMATRVETDDVCENSMCIILGNISPGSIYLSEGDTQLRIDFYGNRYQIYYVQGDTTLYIYSIPITKENELLASTILDTFNETK
jgi:hypothetical protein